MNQAQKPLPLEMWLIAHFSHPGEAIFSGCAGSGTTAEAALSLGRCCVAFERDAVQTRHILQRLRTRFSDYSSQASVELYKNKPLCFKCREGSKHPFNSCVHICCFFWLTLCRAAYCPGCPTSAGAGTTYSLSCPIRRQHRTGALHPTCGQASSKKKSKVSRAVDL